MSMPSELALPYIAHILPSGFKGLSWAALPNGIRENNTAINALRIIPLGGMAQNSSMIGTPLLGGTAVHQKTRRASCPFKLVENALAKFPLSPSVQSGTLASLPARRS